MKVFMWALLRGVEGKVFELSVRCHSMGCRDSPECKMNRMWNQLCSRIKAEQRRMVDTYIMKERFVLLIDEIKVRSEISWLHHWVIQIVSFQWNYWNVIILSTVRHCSSSIQLHSSFLVKRRNRDSTFDSFCNQMNPDTILKEVDGQLKAFSFNVAWSVERLSRAKRVTEKSLCVPRSHSILLCRDSPENKRNRM